MTSGITYSSAFLMHSYIKTAFWKMRGRIDSNKGAHRLLPIQPVGIGRNNLSVAGNTNLLPDQAGSQTT